MLAFTDLFDEQFYLGKNTDVAAAVRSGAIASAFEHFDIFGEVEGRNPSAFFDTSYYLMQNLDVAAAVGKFETTAFEHFIRFGQFEGRNAIPFFDASFYAQNNPDVVARVGSDPITGLYDHFVEYGDREGRNPSALVDTSYYLSNNQDVAVAVQRGEITAAEHFIEFGQFENRNPSRFFDSSYYLTRNSDVNAAVQKRETTAIAHFIEFGQVEGRVPRLLFSQIYVFGDSLSDDGNVFALSGGAAPPSPPYFNGRFTNGPVWAEDLAPRLGLAVNPATNFALGGATSADRNTVNAALPGLQQQVDGFVAAARPSADPNGLYVVWAGANDYLGGGATDFAATVNNVAAAVNKLAAVGARNFMLPNLPNMGATPGAAARGAQVQQGLAQLTAAHNATLAAAAQAIDANPNINIALLDVNSLFNQAIASPASLGFANVTGGLVPGFGGDPSVSNVTLPPGTNANQYLFWDSLHPTARAHELIADTAAKTVTAIPELVSIL